MMVFYRSGSSDHRERESKRGLLEVRVHQSNPSQKSSTNLEIHLSLKDRDREGIA